jgi:putative membrane protein
VRTGISLISIGLVVERAGALVDASMRVGSTNASELFGLALALLGALTLIIGTTQFLRNRRRISTGEFVPSAAAYLIIVTGSLALATVFIIYVLLT